MRASTGPAVTVQAPARLHLGFLDPAGSLGRRFGSVGLVIEGLATEIELSASAHDTVTATDAAAGAEMARAAAHLHTLRQRSGCHAPLQLQLSRVLPPHAGFGSGTQLALAVGRAFALWHGLDLSTATLAAWLGRGLRSGVGIGGFDQGGLLVDGGPGADGAAAPLLARMDLPAPWRIVLVQDSRHQGLSGGEERQALARLAPLPQACAAAVCHQVLMRVLPGAACADFALFAAGVTGVQNVLGDHFAPAQGGAAYASAAVGRLLQWIGEARQAAGGAAIGQSSWGPTGFAILPSLDQAEAVVDAARVAGMADPALSVRIVAARNRGATLGGQPGGTMPASHSDLHRH
jgi:beta-ribofuranosylaminobenzene 5'-phosphate synthase